MKEKDIYKLLSFMMGVGSIDDKYSDYLIFGNEKLLNLSVCLQMEIDELLENGYTMEQIKELIDKCDFLEKEPELSGEEAAILKDHAYELLDIRYKIYIENKKEEKVKKHLFNK